MAISRNDALKGAYHGMEKIKHSIFAGLQVAGIAKVIKYDKKRHVADILPMFNAADGTKSAQYLEVPVAENCYIIDEIIDNLKPQFSKQDTNNTIGAHDGVPAHENTSFVGKLPKKHLMRPGVPVVYVCLDRDLDNWKGGRNAETFTPETGRAHDTNDAIIVGVLGGDGTNG